MKYNKRQFYAYIDGEPTGGEPTTTTEAVPTETPLTPPTETVPVETTAPTETPPSPFDSYKDRPWFANVTKAEDPVAEALKQLDGAQKLIGKKTLGVPSSDADEAEWEAFYSQTRPESVDAYEFKALELGEGYEEVAAAINESRDTEFGKLVGSIFHKYGVDKRRAEAIVHEYEKVSAEAKKDEIKAIIQTNKEMDTTFDKLATEHFGKTTKDSLSEAQLLITQLAPESVKKYLPSLSAEAAITLAVTLKAQQKALGQEDARSTVGNTNAVMTVEERREKVKELMANPAYADRMHPKHKQVADEIGALYG
jgi:uncharacterized protein YdcH (DUF465 family)